MAAAGLKRIGRADRITEFLADSICVSAVAQGALGIEARAGDAVCQEIAFLHDASTFACVCSERSLLRRLGGGCQVPVGARATVSGGDLRLLGAVAAPDGSLLVRGEISGPVDRSEKLGQELAETLLGRGADRILAVV
jgi:hydroxymethylbilane synthase